MVSQTAPMLCYAVIRTTLSITSHNVSPPSCTLSIRSAASLPSLISYKHLFCDILERTSDSPANHVLPSVYPLISVASDRKLHNRWTVECAGGIHVSPAWRARGVRLVWCCIVVGFRSVVVYSGGFSVGGGDDDDGRHGGMGVQ